MFEIVGDPDAEFEKLQERCIVGRDHREFYHYNIHLLWQVTTESVYDDLHLHPFHVIGFCFYHLDGYFNLSAGLSGAKRNIVDFICM